jgi:hypothetical protein
LIQRLQAASYFGLFCRRLSNDNFDSSLSNGSDRLVISREVEAVARRQQFNLFNASRRAELSDKVKQVDRPVAPTLCLVYRECPFVITIESAGEYSLLIQIFVRNEDG